MGALQLRSHGSLHKTRVSVLTECDGANAGFNFCPNMKRTLDLDQKEDKHLFVHLQSSPLRCPRHGRINQNGHDRHSSPKL